MRFSAQSSHLPLAALVCGLWAFALYVFTLAPTFGWGDSADLAMRMVYRDDATFVGGGRDYVLYRAIGGLFQHVPVGDVGTRANLCTAFFGAVTVGIIAAFTGYLTRSIFAGYAAAIALMVSHTFWLMSVIAEVYTFNAMLVFGCYFCVAVWWREQRVWFLFAAVFFAGLALTHHSTGLLLCATIAPLILARVRRLPVWSIAVMAVVFAAASYLYWLRVWPWLMAGAPLLKALGVISPVNGMFEASPLRELVKFVAYVGYNFLGLGVVLMVWGARVMWRQRRWEMLPPVLWLGLLVGAGVNATIPDKFNIYVLVYPVMAVAVGFGALAVRARFLRKRGRALVLLLALALVPPVGYVAAIQATRVLAVDVVGARALPYRDNAWYFMWPGKRGDVGPRRYAEEALAALKPDAVLIADYSLWRPLELLQAVEGVRPDVTLTWTERMMWRGSIADYIATLPCSKPVYLAADMPRGYYQLDGVERRYTVKQAGVVFEVGGRCR